MTTPSRHIHAADRSDFTQIAELIARQNALPRYRCLHSDEGSASGVLFTMNKWADEQAMSFVYAKEKTGNEAEQVVGAFGAEFDGDSRRAWLWGPFAQHGDDEPEAWLALCEQMYGQLLSTLPFEPLLLDGFIDQPFELGARLYQRCGHHLAKTIYVFTAQHPTVPIAPARLLPGLSPEFEAGFVTLFDRVFPDTFYTGAQVVDRVSKTEQVFIFSEQGRVLGFCHANINEGANEGYIEFLGVDEEARRLGIGRLLLETAMHWLFVERNMPKIGLTTGDDNVSAHTLYRGLGFRLAHTGLAYRKRNQDGGEIGQG